ncbi:MAG: hypothetical protein E6X17_01840 [Sporomusaceae bacterium]|nr:hypothetical protein [Sporomusaceae bacterium]
MRYRGEKLFTGKSGAFKIVEAGDVPVIHIFLKSVAAFEEDDSEGGKMALTDRPQADIRISIAYDDIDELWVTAGLTVDTLGLAGVNEFLLALFEQQDKLGTAEALIPLLRQLLDQGEVLWGIDYSPLLP